MDKLGKINSGPVKQMDGRKTAEIIGAEAYVECSAKTRQGVREAFEKAARAVLRADKRKRGRRFFALSRGKFSPCKFYEY